MPPNLRNQIGKVTVKFYQKFQGQGFPLKNCKRYPRPSLKVIRLIQH